MNRKELQTIISEYNRILESRSIEFYATLNWEELEESWREYLVGCSSEELVHLVNGESSNNVPESLENLKIRLKNLQFSRNNVKSPEELWEKWTGTKREAGLQEEFQLMTSDGLIRKRIKAKKQHEIDRIVELVSQIQMFFDEKDEKIDSLVDIGAGVGHLSRIISLKNKLPVLAVEGNSQFTLAANCLDEKVLANSESPIRVTSFVTEDLALKIDEFAENSAILVGLHCCGDFSSTILKVFQKSKKAKALVLFGCCYHKEFQCFHFLHQKTEQEEIPELSISTVFPLSQKWEGFHLSYVLREMACHNNENLAERFRQQRMDLSRYARAQLEKWIWEISDDPEDRNIGMNSVKCVEDETTFEEYIKKAMQKRGNHLMERVLKKIPESILSSLVSSFRCSKFNSFDTLRLLFAPSVESAIVDDRLEFLRENNINARVVPLFEPNFSPRNLAIIAYK